MDTVSWGWKDLGLYPVVDIPAWQWFFGRVPGRLPKTEARRSSEPRGSDDVMMVKWTAGKQDAHQNLVLEVLRVYLYKTRMIECCFICNGKH